MQNQLVPSQQYNNKALAGFFSWLRKAVNNVLNAFSSFIPRPVFMVLDDATNGDGQFNFGGFFDVFSPGGQAKNFNNPTDYPLTTSDEFMLDSWYVNYENFLRPFLVNINNVKESQATIAEIKQVYNQTQKAISALRYCVEVALQDTRNRYTRNALLARNSFLDIQIGMLQASLQDLISQYSITVKPTTETISLRGIDYQLLDFQLPNVFAVSVKAFAVSAIDDVEITDEDNDTGIIDDIVVPPSPTSDKAKGGNFYKWAFTALLLIVLLRNKRKKSIN